jgi:hypothetical protein
MRRLLTGYAASFNRRFAEAVLRTQSVARRVRILAEKRLRDFGDSHVRDFGDSHVFMPY